MKMRMLSAAAIGVIALTASGASASALADSNPNRVLDLAPESGGITSIDDGSGITGGGSRDQDLYQSGMNIGGTIGDDQKSDYGLAQMAVASDDRTARPLFRDGHIAYAADTDDDSPPAYIIAAGLTATTAAGAIAPS